MATRVDERLAGMPVGRRTPSGLRRWYLAQVPDGREDAVCQRLRETVSPELLEDAFVMKKEHLIRRKGVWGLETRNVFPEHVLVVTRDAAALDSALRRTTFAARIAKSDGEHFAPMAEAASAWYAEMMDDQHVIRSSTGDIVNGVLHVSEGPLRGREASVTKIDRHKRLCTVSIAGNNRTYNEEVTLEVKTKT